MKNINSIILLCFMAITFFLTHTQVESFKNNKRKSKNHTKRYRRKVLIKKKNSDENSMNANWFNKPKHEKDNLKEKFQKDMKVREIDRYNLIRNKKSKDTKDAYAKFNALKTGLYDILKLGKIIV